jgi:hypothetical protein
MCLDDGTAVEQGARAPFPDPVVAHVGIGLDAVELVDAILACSAESARLDNTIDLNDYAVERVEHVRVIVEVRRVAALLQSDQRGRVTLGHTTLDHR